MGALTRRDVLFLVWNAAVGLLVGALTVRWPELANAPVPPVLWLVVGMAAFEIGGAALLGGGGPLVTYAMRIIARQSRSPPTRSSRRCSAEPDGKRDTA